VAVAGPGRGGGGGGGGGQRRVPPVAVPHRPAVLPDRLRAGLGLAGPPPGGHGTGRGRRRRRGPRGGLCAGGVRLRLPRRPAGRQRRLRGGAEVRPRVRPVAGAQGPGQTGRGHGVRRLGGRRPGRRRPGRGHGRPRAAAERPARCCSSPWARPPTWAASAPTASWPSTSRWSGSSGCRSA
jgi:hypothetical protein